LAIKYQSKIGLEDKCGTLVYQAPEQMMGDAPYGKAVDLWAVGFIMYEMICGSHPLWVRGEDKNSYKEKLKNYKQLKYPEGKFSR
jgi:serine/threonine protein kinase